MAKKAQDLTAEIEALKKRIEELERKNPMVLIQPAPYPVYVQPWWGWNPYPYYLGPSWVQSGAIVGGLSQGLQSGMDQIQLTAGAIQC